MRKTLTACVACLAILSVAQIPLPPSPTKAHLWSEAGKRLEIDRAILALIVNDAWLSKRIADSGISDISKTPANQPLPHDILTGWQPSKRFKLALIDTEKETQLAAMGKKIDALEKSLEDSRKTVALNSALIQGQIKRIADKINGDDATVAKAKPDEAETLSVPEETLTIPPLPAPEEPKKKKPFFPPVN